MACEECDLTAADESDKIVSAFKTAFDAEDDAAYAKLCARHHEQPVVRHDEEPFTFADDINIGLRAQTSVPMLHFDSATTVENDTLKHDTVDIAASDTSDNDMPFRKQFADSEPDR
ncbi:hypothetical protein CYMTET_48326 [Cymbomonas tetramitiformis]|uniref:Uncharacterized protein n=1 Tax=Cymbomonas tetramitiformis TaxID=36881 RepID=A0AAE0EV98_9CHLO|nr:hypothetical protein CYMTET_48326 [Cymbomonas tetramitiformis]